MAALVPTSVAAAGQPPDSRQSARAKFTTALPHHATGLRLKIDYVNPEDESAKPPAVRRVETILARGSRIDTSVPELCEASDAQLMAQGESACPDGSQVGDGVLTIDSGFPGPGRFVTADVLFLNNTDELIFLSTVRGTGARVVTRASVGQRSTTSEAPMLPGTPPDGGAIDTVRVRLRSIEKAGDAYITTPKNCPEGGRWVNRIRFTYADDVSQAVRSRNGCD